MPSVFRVITAAGAPRLTVAVPPAPHEWVADGRFPPGDAAPASVDRPVAGRQFCHLTPGALVVPEDALDGPNAMYYGLWYGTRRVDLDVGGGGASFACFVPQVVLFADARTGPPCPVDGCYAWVFRLHGRSPTEIFCSSDVGGGDEFRRLYELDAFRGLEFGLVWQGGRP
jgi:hypothetical protein